MRCNGIIERAAKKDVLKDVQALTRRYYDEFYRCDSCKKVYWKGSHYERMMSLVAEIERRKAE